MLINSPNISGSLTVTGNSVITGSLTVLGGINGAITGSATTASYVEYSNVANKPTLVSGSEQVSFNGIVDKPTLVSGSSQVTYSGLTGIPAGIVSGSSQISFNGIVDKPTLVSGSAQISYPNLSNIPNGIVSSSTQITGYNIFATTGSNTFNGAQTITGSIFGTGSLTIDGCITATGQIVAQTINVQQVTSSIVYSCGSNIFGTSLANTQQFTGSMLITGSNITANVGTACFSGNVCAPAMDIMPSGIGSSTLGGIMRIVTTGTSTGIAVGQSNTNRYTHIAANDIQVFNDDFFLSTRCAFPLSIGTCYTSRLTFAATGVACFACQVCAPVAIFSGCVGIGTTSPNTKLQIRDGHIAAYNNPGGCPGAQIYLGDINFDNGSYWNSAPGIGAVYSPVHTTVAGDLAFYVYASSSNSRLEAMRIIKTSAGSSVGIGTCNPQRPLELRTGGTSTTPSQIFFGGYSQAIVGGEVGIAFSSNISPSSGSPTSTELVRAGIGFTYISAAQPSEFSIGIQCTNVCNSNVRIFNGEERLRISSTGIACFQNTVCAPAAIFTGCVGIGNTNPQSRLTIAPLACTTVSTIEFTNSDNAVISSHFSMNFAVNNSNTQSGRAFVFASGNKGYGNQCNNIASFTADDKVASFFGTICAPVTMIGSSCSPSAGINYLGREGYREKFLITQGRYRFCFGTEDFYGAIFIEAYATNYNQGTAEVRNVKAVINLRYAQNRSIQQIYNVGGASVGAYVANGIGLVWCNINNTVGDLIFTNAGSLTPDAVLATELQFLGAGFSLVNKFTRICYTTNLYESTNPYV